MIVTVEERKKYKDFKGYREIFEFDRHVYSDVYTVRIDPRNHILKTYVLLEAGISYEFSEPYYDTSVIKVTGDTPEYLILLTIGDFTIMSESFYIDTGTIRDSSMNRIIDYDKDISYQDKELVFTFGKEKASW